MDDIGGLLPVEKKATVRHLITARSGIYHAASNAGDSSADAPDRGSQEPGEYFLHGLGSRKRLTSTPENATRR
jgi:hypothetical protein